jgi:hypothetical protein
MHLVQCLMFVHLSTQHDVFKWNLTSNGKFTVNSMYLDMINGNNPFLWKYIWKIKVPLKIRIFMWFLHKNVFLQKTILLNVIGMVVQNVVSVMNMKHYNIYSFHVLLQKSSRA